MRSTFKILFYVNKTKIKADGTTVVMCRISIDGKTTSMSTGVNVIPNGFKAQNSKELMRLKERIEQIYDKILKSHGVVSAELLKNTINGINSVPQCLLQGGEVERERLRL